VADQSLRARIRGDAADLRDERRQLPSTSAMSSYVVEHRQQIDRWSPVDGRGVPTA
jgi:hypothetical protein